MTTTLTLTELETLVLNGVKAFEGSGEDCTIERLTNVIYNQNDSCPSTRVLRGVLSSLVKKNVLSIYEGYIDLI